MFFLFLLENMICRYMQMVSLGLGDNFYEVSNPIF